MMSWNKRGEPDPDKLELEPESEHPAQPGPEPDIRPGKFTPNQDFSIDPIQAHRNALALATINQAQRERLDRMSAAILGGIASQARFEANPGTGEIAMAPNPDTMVRVAAFLAGHLAAHLDSPPPPPTQPPEAK